ncbi:hypothetical protein BCR36DRAFT_416472 [Piromyces finnis]|uniref:DUF3533 domain-containing protein n=1 Tax=Piromyces finnis TaxID=1754191 RepID=A0A1Y1UV41_9FUNG|nr:hypothetical protein BCR36DRAFT_416472 [Piromyces finnis]|eukprot:ORX41877.1 hypothetical protein BCR36DRAFT_416472 [Piromyces finnis]
MYKGYSKKLIVSLSSIKTNDPLVNERPFFIRSNSSKITDSTYYEKYKLFQKENEFQLKKEKSKKVWIPMFIYMIIISLFAFVFGFLYIGGLWNPGKKLLGVNYVIINNDKGCYTNACAKMGLDKSLNLGNYYHKLDGTGGRFTVINGNRDTAIQNIKKYKYWAAFYIPEKFTSDVLSNLNAYKKQLTKVTVEVILDESRSYNTVSLIRKALRKLQNNFFVYLAKSFEDKGGFNPPFLIEGITYEETSLHKLVKYGHNFSTFISLMLIWISSISATIITHFFFPFESHWLEKKVVHNPYLKIILTKIFISSLMTLFMTFVIVIIQVICGNLEIEKGYASFFFFIFFFSLIGLSVNNTLIHLLPFIGFYLSAVIFMMLQITTCGGILDNTLQYGFWKIGKALPMYYGVRQLKNIIWKVGEHTIWVNLVVLFAWLIVFTIISLILYKLELRARREKWLRHQHRILFNYNNKEDSNNKYYSSDNWLNDTTLTPLANEEIPMESMEDFDFPDKNNENNISSKTLEEQEQELEYEQ